MFKKENLIVFVIMGLAVSYAVLTFIIFITRGKLGKLIRKKVSVGLALVSFIGFLNGCSLDGSQSGLGATAGADNTVNADSSTPSPTPTFPAPSCYTPTPTFTSTKTPSATTPAMPTCYTPTPTNTPANTPIIVPTCYTPTPTSTPTGTPVIKPTCYTPTPTNTPAPTPTPVIMALEGENYSGQSGCAVANIYSGYSGAGYLDFGGRGTWAEWKAAISATRSYTLSIRYANGTASNRRCELKVNGIVIGNVPFAPTGVWNNWQTIAITLNLVNGDNPIRLQANTSTGGPNIDKLEIK